MRTRQWLPADCQLTKREVECLRWAAVGKTDKEISLILARSHATVRFHIQNAGEKPDAVNRSKTIFKAGQLGSPGLAAVILQRLNLVPLQCPPGSTYPERREMLGVPN